MASEICMPTPVCLIENTEGQLVVNQEALEVLSATKNPLVVVAIVGLYRTGKSYLMNKLAGKNKGFSIGSTVQSHTKGIWMWCVPHPKKPDHTLVLLDTEGLGDVEKGDKNNDTQIFVLAILLSSTFVYNTMNKIDQRAMDLLHYVTELSNLLWTVSSPDLDGVEDTTNFASFYPDLVWTLRDFYLALEIDGQLITEDEYLENSLKLKQGTDKTLQNFNLPRLCIKEFFPIRKCFIFDSPAHCKKLAQLETLDNDELDPEFVQQVAAFCSYIFNHSKTKTLSGGIKVNGPYLKSLVQTCVNAISRGDLPCTENSVVALAQFKNSAAVKKAIVHYDQQMGQKLQMPTETVSELLDLHRACEKEAMEVFMKNSFKDVNQKFQKELEALLEAKKDDFHNQNMEASSNRCSALLQAIFGPLENEAEKALREYLQSQQSTSDTILQTDLALTARQKEIDEAHRKAEAAKIEAQRLQEIQRHNQQMLEERQRLHLQQVRQMEIFQQNLRRQQQMALERRQQEEMEKLKREIEDERRRLQNEMHYLQRNVDSRDDTCILL